MKYAMEINLIQINKHFHTLIYNFRLFTKSVNLPIPYRMNNFSLSVLLVLIIVTTISENVTARTSWNKKISKYAYVVTRKPHIRLKAIKQLHSEENVLQPRIVGGRPAVFGEAPYFMRMQAYGEFQCGASLLSYRGLMFAVTAAHCLWEGDKNLTSVPAAHTAPKDLNLVGADVDKVNYDPREQWFDIDAVVLHWGWDPTTFENDIALMFLNQYAHESLGLEHVPLPGVGWKDPQWTNIVGHGAKLRFDYQRYLQLLELQVVEWNACNVILETHGIFPARSNEFCVGHPNIWIREGICFGDSGGPIVAFNYSLQRWYLAGVISRSSLTFCGTPSAVTVITKISDHVPWIRDVAELRLKFFGTGNPYTNGTPEPPEPPLGE